MNRLQFVPSSIFLIMALFWVQTSPAGNMSSDAELAQLKKELAELKREYASRFMRLESKIAAFEHGEGDSTNQSPGVADSPGLDPGTTSTGPEKKLVIPLTAEKDVNPANSDGVKQPAPPAKTSNATVTKVDPHEYAYEGHVRSAFWINGKGGDMEPFKAPGSEAKYRLGNEGETYGEAALIHNYLDTSGPTFKTQIRIGYQSKNHMDDDVDNDTSILRKAFTQMANFTWAPSVNFWAGERFYRRHDIYINDFYVFDMSGYGGGAEDIPMGKWGKLAAAWLGGSTDDYEFPSVGRVAKNTLDLRLYDVALPGGKGMFWFAPSYLAGGSYTADGETIEYDNTAGCAVGFMHTNDKPLGLSDSYNQFTLQYGRGTGSNFSPVAQAPSVDLKDSWKFRLTESGVFQVKDNISVMPVFVWQIEDLGVPEDSKITWVSACARHIYSFTEHISLALEAGLDYVDNEPLGVRDYLFKGSLAAQLSFGELFFSRPVLRVYATCAQWGSGFEGHIGGKPFEDATSGANFGVQMEA